VEKKIKPMIYQTDRKIELLHSDKYKEYKYYILNLGTHPTAYIEIPKGNVLYEKDYNEIYDKGYDIDVHGGLTYSRNELMGIKSENWFIGWDYAHYSDYMPFYDEFSISLKKWTTEEIIEECKNVIEQIIEINKN
jgi:hypothetical protein